MKMDEDTLKTNLNTLNEMVMDEQKIVTYVTLSKDLCIHVNESKTLLLKFLESMRKKEPDLQLNVGYVISGIFEDNKARTTVTSGDELEKIRGSMKVVFFEHIYSVSKSPASVDNIALLSVSRFEDLPLCTGLIKSISCEKRSADEISNLKSSSQMSVETDHKPPPKKVKDENKNSSRKDEQSTSITKAKETKSEPNIKIEVPSPTKETVSAKPKPDNKKNGTKTQKGIAGFFNKSNSAPSKIISKETTKEKQDVIVKKEKETLKEPCEVKEEKMDVDEPVVECKKEVKEKHAKSETKKEQVNGKSKNKQNDKLTQIKKNAKVDKKRKRLLRLSDSEDEDDKDPFIDESEPQEPDCMSDDEIPPTPAVNTVKITSGILNPKKRRKIVDKTYMDDNGYIITKKEEVYESCSDKEEDVPKENVQEPMVNKIQVKQETSPKEKKNGPKNSKKKISPPQKGKQATMMNFFKKI